MRRYDATEPLVALARKVGGIRILRLKKALENKVHQQRIEKDMAAISEAGLRIGTPSFLIGQNLLQGAQPFDKFKETIDAELGDEKN